MFFKHARPVPEGNEWTTHYYYSKKYGWFDSTHFKDHEVLEKVRRAVAEGGGEFSMEDRQVGDIALYIDYYVSGDTEEDQVPGVALGVFMNFQADWEEWQGAHGIAASFTYYSIEDLPSNMLKFIASYRHTTTEELLTELNAYQTNDHPPDPGSVGKTYFKPRQLNLSIGKYIERDWPAHWNLPTPIGQDSGLWHRVSKSALSPFRENVEKIYY